MIKIVFLLTLTFSVFLGDILTPLKYRAVENRFYNTISKINSIHYYINDYIMNNAKMPNIADISMYSAIDTGAWWPKNYENISNVTYTLDSNNSYVIYSNIFSTIPELEIINIFTKNVLIKQDAVINMILDLMMPLDVKTIEFLKLASSIQTSANRYINKRVNITCNIGTENHTMFEPNGSGDFNIYICKSGNWEDVEFYHNWNYKTATQTIPNISYKNNRIYYDDLNSTNLRKMIWIDATMARRIKR